MSGYVTPIPLSPFSDTTSLSTSSNSSGEYPGAVNNMHDQNLYMRCRCGATVSYTDRSEHTCNQVHPGTGAGNVTGGIPVQGNPLYVDTSSRAVNASRHPRFASRFPYYAIAWGGTVGIYLDYNDVYNNLHTPQAKGTYLLRGFIEIKDAELWLLTNIIQPAGRHVHTADAVTRYNANRAIVRGPPGQTPAVRAPASVPAKYNYYTEASSAVNDLQQNLSNIRLREAPQVVESQVPRRPTRSQTKLA